MRTKALKLCLYCKQEFLGSSRQVFCKKTCCTQFFRKTMGWSKRVTVCKQCGKSFEAKVRGTSFCNALCKNKWRIGNVIPAKPCAHCGKLFKVSTIPSKRSPRLYCSSACGLRATKPTRLVVCLDCGASVTHHGRGKRYRCVDCQRKKAAARHYDWVVRTGRIARPGLLGGNRTDIRRVYSRSYAGICYSFWPRECVACAAKKRLQVHHIDGDPENNAPTNLVPLCRSCHMSKVHRGNGGTKEELITALFRIWPTGRLKIAEKIGNPQNGQSEVKADLNGQPAATTSERTCESRM